MAARCLHVVDLCDKHAECRVYFFQDIDECTTGVHGCPLQTRCINTAGMFLCTGMRVLFVCELLLLVFVC